MSAAARSATVTRCRAGLKECSSSSAIPSTAVGRRGRRLNGRPEATIGHLTAENLSVDAENGIRYAYRRFGKVGEGRPLVVFLQHFRGNLENWDPLLIDELAAER